MKGNETLLTILNQRLADEGSVDLLTKILRMEEGHVDWAEIKRAQIDQMGVENYLTNQSDKLIR